MEYNQVGILNEQSKTESAHLHAAVCQTEMLRESYVFDGQVVGAMNNRLQACVNLLHLLGTNAALDDQARMLITHLQSEVALLRNLLKRPPGRVQTLHP